MPKFEALLGDKKTKDTAVLHAEKEKEEVVDLGKAAAIKKEIDGITQGKKLADLELDDLKKVLARYREIENVLGISESEKSLTPELSETIKSWQNFYQETFKIKPDFSRVEIPEKREGFEKLLIIAKGMTAQKLFDQCQELFPSTKYTEENLDKIITSDRNANKEAYAIWIRDCIEADEELKDLSADAIKEQGLITETLEERLLQELEYFKRTKEHLDKENVTLCTGSRLADGFVPCVDWDGGWLRVDWDSSGRHGDHWRAREAVSSAEGGK